MAVRRYRSRLEVLQGTLDLIILETLRWGPLHGYGLTLAISARSADALRVDTGAMYPALHRLERRGWVAAAWKLSDNKQRTRVYRLTRAGRQQLSAERSRWEKFSQAMAGILGGEGKVTAS
jgi:PadR family transcriptional regulator, regulatory protein PadR